MQTNHLVIMAGGVGSRFWPMSTPQCPKQFIDVLGIGRSLLQMTVDRFQGLVENDHIWVVTSKDYINMIREQLPQLPMSNILAEPCMRNTAPCIAYVTWKIKMYYPNANIVVTPADHLVMNVASFNQVIREGLAYTAMTDAIVTVGIVPHRPETGYGYIKVTDQTSTGLAKVIAFKEKPDLETAKQYLRTMNYYWNSGIFIWNAQTIERSIRKYQPHLAELCDRMQEYFYTEQEQKIVDELFPLCQSISIDYAVMEQSDRIYVLPGDFGWSDLGTWGSLYEQLPHDAMNNAVVGEKIKLIESSGCVVQMPDNKRAVIQGLHHYIIAERNNTLLICRLEDEQRIKEFAKEI